MGAGHSHGSAGMKNRKATGRDSVPSDCRSRHSDDRRFVVWVAGFAGRCCPAVFADVFGVFMALVAVTIAARPTKQRRTFGLYRLEILATAANGLLLLGLSAFILIQAYERWFNPEQINAPIMLAAATYGPVANGVVCTCCAAVQESRGARAYLEVMSDARFLWRDDRRRCHGDGVGTSRFPGIPRNSPVLIPGRYFCCATHSVCLWRVPNRGGSWMRFGRTCPTLRGVVAIHDSTCGRLLVAYADLVGARHG